MSRTMKTPEEVAQAEYADWAAVADWEDDVRTLRFTPDMFRSALAGAIYADRAQRVKHETSRSTLTGQRGVEVSVWPSAADVNVTVVQIDTQETTGHVRVYVNDEVVFDADPEVGA